jgi:hypothetical protein
MRYNLRNSKGQYFCLSSDTFAYVWVDESILLAREREGLISFVDARAAETTIAAANTPKKVKRMVRPDYPNMSDAQVVAVEH